MSELDREFKLYWGVIYLVFGLIFIIWGLIGLLYTEIITQSKLYEHSHLLLGLIFLCIGCFNIIFVQYAKSRYQEYPSNDICDYCGVKVEKIKLRNYSPVKIVLCKKCHKKHFIFTAIFIEITLLIVILLFFLTLPTSTDIYYMIFTLSILFGLAIATPPLIIFQIRRY